MDNKINFTKKALEAIPPPKKRSLFYDKNLRGLAFSITPNDSKTFLVYRKINGKPRKITLGKFPDMAIEQARRKAQQVLSEIAGGMDPAIQRQIEKQKAITLSEVFETYLQIRSSLKPGTIHDYRRIFKECFSDWKDIPISQITKEKALERHMKLGEKSKARANNAMRVLRALYNFAAAQYESADGTPLYTINPTRRLSDTRSWYKIERRKTFIKPHELPRWYKAIQSIETKQINGVPFTTKFYLLLLLFTGLRRQELAQLKWRDVDLNDRSFTLGSSSTKNSEQHVVPMSDYVVSIFEELEKIKISQFVFPGLKPNTHLQDSRWCMKNVIKESGVKFTPHDLRRTFITIAESLDISIYTIKRLINHKISQDVTAGYIISYTDRLRKATQMVTDHILQVTNTSTTSSTLCAEIA